MNQVTPPNNLEYLLDEGREIIAAQERQKAEEEAENLRKEAEFQNELETAALKLIPEAVRPFANLYRGNNDWLRIELPNAALVERMVVHSCHSNGNLEKVSFATLTRGRNSWSVHRWGLYEEEATLVCVKEFAELPAALAYAVQVGDGKAEAEAQAARLLEARSKAAELEERLPVDFCPLIKDYCKEEACAWWNKDWKACSAWVIGKKLCGSE